MCVLECDGEACVDIDACLRIVPTAATAIHETACLSTTVASIFGIEDIIDLAQ